MKFTLAFAPPANPSYVPLGVASLSSYLHERLPEVETRIVDLNLCAWRYLLENNLHGPGFWKFMQGRSGDFFDESLYLKHQQTWDYARTGFRELQKQILGYLASGETEPAALRFLDHLAEKVLADSPSVIGFSVMFPDQLAFSAALAKRLFHIRGLSARESRHARPFRIIFGGALMSAIHVKELLFACPFIDAAVTGEGEGPLGLYLQGFDPESIPGLYHVKNEMVVKPRRDHPVSLENLPAPDFQSLWLNEYANPEPVLPLTFSRNCKWHRCRFCAHNFSFSGYRQRSVGMFVDDLEHLVNHRGVRHFYLADQYVPAATLEALAEEILGRGLSVNFHVMGRPTKNYTPALLQKAAKAGCRWISWGVETGSQRLLDLICKGTQKDDIARVMRDSHRAGISNLAMMIFGLPTGTQTDLEQTFSLIDDIYPHVATFTASSFALFEKTYFARNAEKFGLKIIKNEILFRVDSKSVRSRRLQYMRLTDSQRLAPPSGPIEVDRWTQRRRWLGEVPFVEQLCCEHFLIHAAKNARDRINPIRPINRAA